MVPCRFSQCQCSAIAGTPHHTNILHPSCTPNNSTTTTAMDEAIEALERGREEEEIGDVAIAKRFGVNEATLRRRHQGKCSARVEAAQEQKNLSTQQEEELVECNDAGKTRDPNLAWSHSEAYESVWENRNLGSIDTYRSCTKGLQKTAYLHLGGCHVRYTKAMKS
jgi:hypothetical protein